MIHGFDEAIDRARAEHDGDDRPEDYGLVESRKARSTGSIIELYDADNAGNAFSGEEDNGGRWVTYCATHEELCQYETRRKASSWMAEPETWCEGCHRSTPVEDLRDGDVILDENGDEAKILIVGVYNYGSHRPAEVEVEFEPVDGLVPQMEDTHVYKTGEMVQRISRGRQS